MPLAVLGPILATAGTATGAIVASKIASNANNNAANIAAKSQTDSNAAQTQSNEETLNFQKQQAENDYRNQEITRQANYNQYASGQNRLKFLDSAVGLPERTVPDYVPSIDPNFSGAPSAGQVLNQPSSSTPPQTGASGASSYLKSLLDTGMDPKQAADQTNAKFPGAAALYYPPSPNTSGKAVIGLPDSYLSQETNGWNITQRSASEGAPKATAPASTAVTPYSANAYLQQRQNPLPNMLSSGY